MPISYTATVRKTMEARVPRADIFQIMLVPAGVTAEQLTGVRWDSATDHLVFEFGTHDEPFALDAVPAGPILINVA